MKVAEYKQTGTRTEQRIVHHDPYEEVVDDTLIMHEGYDETVEVEVPVMGMVYRDATPEEEAQAEAEAEQARLEEANREPTTEERLAAMEDALAEMMGVIFDG